MVVVGLFCFDGPLYKDINGIYCNVTLTNEVFNRYFYVVDKLYVVVRTFTTEKTYDELNMKPLKLDNMIVVEVENLNTAVGLLWEQKIFKKKISTLIKDVDLIFARMPSTTSDAVISVAIKQKKLYLVEVGGCVWDAFWNHGFIGKMMAPYMYITARKNIKKASFATYVTKDFLQKRYPNKGVTASCSNVYLSQVDESVLDERLRKIESLDIAHPVFGQAVNSIDVKYKGEHLIIRAMKDLKEKGIIAEYQVVGPGTGKFLIAESKKYGVADQLKIMGTLKKSEIMEWYKSIDLYVQPSKQEGLPRSVIEAMSVGCPVIGSNVAGIPELLDSDCLFNLNRSDGVINTLLHIVNRDTMKIQAKRNYIKSKDYQLEDIENRRKEIFEKYMNSVQLIQSS